MSLRTTAVYCLAVWAAIWLLFMVMRFSPLDIRIIPGIGPIMLIALMSVLVAPIAAMVIAGTAIVREPRAAMNWLVLGCAIAAIAGEAILFMLASWL